MREIQISDLEGKTISKVEKGSINNMKLVFSDGTSLSIWTEPLLFTAYGNICGFVIEEECDSVKETETNNDSAENPIS